MAEHTEISWTDHTFNAWWSCDEVSPACDHCYARVLAARFGYGWGADAPRRFFGPAHWKEPLRWNERARQAGVQKKVFCASMGDVFEILPGGHPDGEAMEAARLCLWRLIEGTPSLIWQLLTKRPKNILRLVPADWRQDGFPANVWVGATVENQEWAEKRIPHLLQVPAVVRFLSCEPLLGPVDLSPFHIGWSECPRCGTAHDPSSEFPLGGHRFCGGGDEVRCEWDGGLQIAGHHLHWVIAGGESGHGARPSHPDWFRSLRDQCQAAGVVFHFKQWGEWGPLGTGLPVNGWSADGDGRRGGKESITVNGQEYVGRFERREIDPHLPTGVSVYRVGKKAAGRMLDGRTWDELPEGR